MTWKDLQRIVTDLQDIDDQQKLDIINPKLFSLKGLPFYCEWQDNSVGIPKEFNDCCFNHAIGLPKRNGTEYPLFPYEKLLFDTLQSNKMVYLLKCTGAGATEFMIRYISWLCLKDDKLKGSQVVIATGPRIETSIAIIERMKHLFIDSEFVTDFDTKQTIIELNGIRTTAVPSDHLDTARGIPNVSMFYSDETAFYSNKEQENLRDVAERYIAKSHPQIVLISTPNKPMDLMNQIQNEPEETCLYKRLYFDYTICLKDGMFTEDEIALQKLSPSFEREYNLKFLGGIGNVFNPHDIDTALTSGNDYNPFNDEVNISLYYPRTMGIDVGFGSSNFAIVIQQVRDGMVEIIYADSFPRPTITEALDVVQRLFQKYHIKKCYIDASAPGFISELKSGYQEMRNYSQLKPEVLDGWILSDSPRIVPVDFRSHGPEMLHKCVELIQGRHMRIHKSFTKLEVALRTAVTNELSKLDKSETSENDVLDAFRLSLLNVRTRKINEPYLPRTRTIK